MWATTLNIVALLSMLGALAYVALAARRLDAKLGALVEVQGASRRDLERQVERVRSSVIPACPAIRSSSQPHLTAHFQQPVARHAEMNRGKLAVAAHECEQPLAP
jgi:hypothetical protein